MNDPILTSGLAVVELVLAEVRSPGLLDFAGDQVLEDGQVTATSSIVSEQKLEFHGFVVSDLAAAATKLDLFLDVVGEVDVVLHGELFRPVAIALVDVLVSLRTVAEALVFRVRLVI